MQPIAHHCATGATIGNPTHRVYVPVPFADGERSPSRPESRGSPGLETLISSRLRSIPSPPWSCHTAAANPRGRQAPEESSQMGGQAAVADADDVGRGQHDGRIRI